MNMSGRSDWGLSQSNCFLKDFGNTVCSDLFIFDMSARYVENEHRMKNEKGAMLNAWVKVILTNSERN